MDKLKEKTKLKLDLPPDEEISFQLNCPNCKNSITSDEINIQKAIAKCKKCNHVFAFEEELELARRKRPEVMMPKGLDVLKLEDELDVQLRWKKTMKNASGPFLIFFAIVWNAILWPIVIGGVASGNYGIILFTILHLLVGIGLIFYIIAYYFNSTHLVATADSLRILHLPVRLPFFKQKNIDPQQIEQLYVHKYVSSTNNGVKNYAYALYAILKNKEKVKLLKGMNKATQLYMEQELESFLNIKDKPVEGEILE